MSDLLNEPDARHDTVIINPPLLICLNHHQGRGAAVNPYGTTAQCSSRSRGPNTQGGSDSIMHAQPLRCIMRTMIYHLLSPEAPADSKTLGSAAAYTTTIHQTSITIYAWHISVPQISRVLHSTMESNHQAISAFQMLRTTCHKYDITKQCSKPAQYS